MLLMDCLGRWSTAINPGLFRAVSGDGEGKQQEDKGRFWMYAWMRSTVADLSACLQMIPKLEPHPPAHWPLCKLTPIWNGPKIPFSAVSKAGSITEVIVEEAAYSRSVRTHRQSRGGCWNLDQAETGANSVMTRVMFLRVLKWGGMGS